MVANIKLQDMTQLVLEKITSFLNQKQLLVLEQISKKLKSVVSKQFKLTGKENECMKVN